MEEGQPQRRPRYAGEDTRLTSEKELRGWYSYGLGAEVFAVVGVGISFNSHMVSDIGL